MVGENGYPVTPDWLPEPRDGSIRPALQPSLNEAIGAWDRDWAHWSGDDS